MDRIKAVLRDERGIALVMALVMLVAMTGLMLAFISVSAFEPQISQNLVATSQARMIAEAGLEWGFDQLATVPALPAAPPCSPAATAAQAAHWNTKLAMPGGQISGPSAMQVPGPSGPMPPAYGTFVVTIRNDTNAADRIITGFCQTSVTPCPAGQGADPGGAVNDTNGIVLMTSTATVRGVQKTLRTAVRRPSMNFCFNGAVSFPGTQADVGFTGDSFEISGNDWRMPPAGVTPGAPDGVNPAVWGIATSGDPAYAGNEATVEATLTATQDNNVTGKRENAAQAGQGDNTINSDPGATRDAVHQFIHEMGQVPPGANVTKMSSSQLNPASINGGTFGSATNPVLVHVKATEADPTSLFTALTINGPVTGWGILIVEDGDLRINGDFRWNGPIIVSGGYVGIGFMGGGNQQVYGAVVSNELATNEPVGFKEGLFTGAAKIRYSKEALDNAINGFMGNNRKAMGMYSWRED